MGYYGGEVIPGPCEDFPCCGHYDDEGSFCPQPWDIPSSLEYTLRKAENKWHEEERARKEREAYERAPSSCGEYVGGAWIEPGEYCGYCKECIAEADDREREGMRWEEEYR